MNERGIRFLASFDVDAQNCFTPICADELPVPDGHTIVPELNAQASWARLRIGSKDAHPQMPIWLADAKHPPLSTIAGRGVDVRWPRHAVVGSKGFELLAGLPHPNDYDYFVWKGQEPDMHPYGACYHDLTAQLSTGVIEYLHSKHISHVVLGGLALEYCVQTTALQLVAADFTVIINLAATRGLDAAVIATAKHAMHTAGVKFIAAAYELQNLINY